MMKITKNNQESANTTQMIILSQAIRGIKRSDLYKLCYAHQDNVCIQIRSLKRKGYIEEGYCDEEKIIVITDTGFDFWKITLRMLQLALSVPQK